MWFETTTLYIFWSGVLWKNTKSKDSLYGESLEAFALVLVIFW